VKPSLRRAFQEVASWQPVRVRSVHFLHRWKKSLPGNIRTNHVVTCCYIFGLRQPFGSFGASNHKGAYSAQFGKSRHYRVESNTAIHPLSFSPILPLKSQKQQLISQLKIISLSLSEACDATSGDKFYRCPRYRESRQDLTILEYKFHGDRLRREVPKGNSCEGRSFPTTAAFQIRRREIP
jgi:hypothetical protein